MADLCFHLQQRSALRKSASLLSQSTWRSGYSEPRYRLAAPCGRKHRRAGRTYDSASIMHSRPERHSIEAGHHAERGDGSHPGCSGDARQRRSRPCKPRTRLNESRSGLTRELMFLGGSSGIMTCHRSGATSRTPAPAQTGSRAIKITSIVRRCLLAGIAPARHSHAETFTDVCPFQA